MWDGFDIICLRSDSGAHLGTGNTVVGWLGTPGDPIRLEN
jgi:hypothetical protein